MDWIDKKFGVKRVIVGYEKDPGSKPVVEYGFKEEIKLGKLQALFNEEADHPMFDCYQLDEQQAYKLQPLVIGKIDLNKYDFFLEAYQHD